MSEISQSLWDSVVLVTSSDHVYRLIHEQWGQLSYPLHQASHVQTEDWNAHILYIYDREHDFCFSCCGHQRICQKPLTWKDFLSSLEFDLHIFPQGCILWKNRLTSPATPAGIDLTDEEIVILQALFESKIGLKKSQLLEIAWNHPKKTLEKTEWIHDSYALEARIQNLRKKLTNLKVRPFVSMHKGRYMLKSDTYSSSSPCKAFSTASA